MPKKRADPFVAELWDALIAARLGPAGESENWAQTSIRIRNRFTKAVRQAMTSPAAFAASTDVVPVSSGALPKARRAD